VRSPQICEQPEDSLSEQVRQAENKGSNINQKNERERRLLCFEQICPTKSDADYEDIERLTESFISPQKDQRYSIDRISLFGSKLLDFTVGERKADEPEGLDGAREMVGQMTGVNADFPAFKFHDEDKTSSQQASP
jgi:hypothetical protein